MSDSAEKGNELAPVLAGMQQEENACVLSPSGDTILHVGMKPCNHILVSSRVMETASPIFAIMVARARMRQRPRHARLHIRFKYDNPFIIKVLFSILHEIEMFLVHDWDVNVLWDLIRVAQNYHCAPLLLEFIDGLYPIFAPLVSIGFPGIEDVNPVDRFEEQLKLVAISMTVDSDMIFTELTKTMISEYVPGLAEEVGLDWSILSPEVYGYVFDAIKVLSQDFKDDLQEGLDRIEETVTSIAENVDGSTSRCPLSFINCFKYTLQSNGPIPSSAAVYEVRDVLKRYVWSLDGRCPSRCASCDALKEVKKQLNDLLHLTDVTGLCLSDWLQCAPSATRAGTPFTCSSDDGW
ncbi:hypothetical protein DTO166G4_4545 [Paecilomyces variotii]|nr:hypothetical protein DTO166G4_4545 [Paecilomyces variotii]KAJ9240015.1 hypothetical protein DTO166G5_1880 [Paecilomyces variotii]